METELNSKKPWTETNFLWNKLLETVLLLIGLATFNTALVAIVSFAKYLFTSEYYGLISGHIHWIGRICFGIIIYVRLRRIRVAAPVGLLSVVTPVFGGVFYIMTSTLSHNDNER